MAGSKQEIEAYEAQAIGRAHRQGQKNKVTIVRFYVEGTIEETMHNRRKGIMKGTVTPVLISHVIANGSIFSAANPHEERFLGAHEQCLDAIGRDSTAKHAQTLGQHCKLGRAERRPLMKYLLTRTDYIVIVSPAVIHLIKGFNCCFILSIPRCWFVQKSQTEAVFYAGEAIHCVNPRSRSISAILSPNRLTKTSRHCCLISA